MHKNLMNAKMKENMNPIEPTHTSGGLSTNLLQLFISVGELSSSELGDLWMLATDMLISLKEHEDVRISLKQNKFQSVLLSVLSIHQYHHRDTHSKFIWGKTVIALVGFRLLDDVSCDGNLMSCMLGMRILLNEQQRSLLCTIVLQGTMVVHKHYHYYLSIYMFVIVGVNYNVTVVVPHATTLRSSAEITASS